MINPFIVDECKRANIEMSPIETHLNETYGQCNEDLIIEALLIAHCWRKQTKMHQIYYIEIGANHPFQTGATYLFYRLYDAKGVLCEANPHLIQNLRMHRPRDTVVNAVISASHEKRAKFFIAAASELSSMDREHIRKFESRFHGMATVVEEIEVENIHINNFMATNAGQGVDFLSIDTEGTDYAILDAMDMERFRPAFVQLEHNSNLLEYVELLEPRDYVCLGVTEVNQIFADKRALSNLANASAI